MLDIRKGFRMEKNKISSIMPKDCCGCGSCINACPKEALTYGQDDYGFAIPIIDNDKCIDCGKCVNVCPAIVQNKKVPRNAYAAIARDNNILLGSSSGGIFAVLANEILRRDGVVYGCTMDLKFQVKHIRVGEKQQLSKIMRSKYVQSDMGNIYHQINADLQDGKNVLFVGTPCQVAAVDNFCKGNEKLLTIDIVCHGVPSQKFFDSYLEDLKKKKGEISGYAFRSKRYVRNGMNCFFSFVPKKNGKQILRNWPEDAFNYLYMKSYIYRESCYNCKFASEERVGDITLCDYWGWDNYHKEFLPGSTVSAVLVNNFKGKELLRQVENELKIVPTNIDNIKRHNGCLVKPSTEPEKREALLKYWRKNGFTEIDRMYKKKSRFLILKCVFMRKISQNLMSYFVKVKKLLKGV